MEDIVSESAILAGLYQYGQEAYFEVSEVLNNDCFTDEANSAIFQCFDKIFKEGASKIDLPLLMSAANSLGFSWIWERKEELQQLKGILNTNVELSNIRRLASKIRKLDIGRKLSKLTRTINLEVSKINGEQSYDDIVGLVENPMFEFFNKMENSENTSIKLSNVVDEYIENVENHVVDIVGLSTGYPLIDHTMGGGLRNGTVSMFSARKKLGKSQLCLNIALNVAKRGIPVLYADSEMNYKIHLPRVLANIVYKSGHKITITEIETGKYSRLEKNKFIIQQAKEEFKKYPIEYVSVNGKNFSTISSIIKRWLSSTVKGQQCLVILDYLKLNNSEDLSKAMAEYQILGFLVSDLHNLAVKYNFPVLTAGQTNRDGITEENTGVVSGSDRILDIVSSFSLLKDKSAEEIADCGIEYGNKKLVPICSRFGEGLQQNDYINLQFYGQYGTFIEVDTRFNIKTLQQRAKEEPKQDEQISLGEI